MHLQGTHGGWNMFFLMVIGKSLGRKSFRNNVEPHCYTLFTTGKRHIWCWRIQDSKTHLGLQRAAWLKAQLSNSRMGKAPYFRHAHLWARPLVSQVMLIEYALYQDTSYCIKIKFCVLLHPCYTRNKCSETHKAG